MGCAQQGSSSPLSLSASFQAAEILELPGPAGSTQDSSAGQVDVLGSASGGSTPYSFAWTVTELSDQGNCAVLAAGTQNVANYTTLTFRSVVPANAFDPPVEAAYRLRCTVTDAASATATSDLTLTVVTLPL